MDYRCEDRKNVGDELRGDIGVVSQNKCALHPFKWFQAGLYNFFHRRFFLYRRHTSPWISDIPAPIERSPNETK